MSYSGLTTKIRAMQSHLLNVQNFREIVELEGVPQAVNYLKDKPSYGPLLGNLETEDLHRGQIERLLKRVYTEISLSCTVSPTRRRENFWISIWKIRGLFPEGVSHQHPGSPAAFPGSSRIPGVL